MEIVWGFLSAMLMIVGGLATGTFVVLLLIRVLGKKGVSIKSGAIGAGTSFFVFLASFIALLIIAINAPPVENKVQEVAAPLVEKVQAFTPEMDVHSEVVDNQLTVNGETNLPDGTNLIVTLQDPQDEYFDTNISVDAGKFSMPAISIEELKPGEQIVNISLADEQPAAVLDVIGKDGELLVVSATEGEVPFLVSSTVDIPAERSPPSDVKGMKADVTKVLDGQTIQVQLNGKEETIKLGLVSTPEVDQSSSGERPFASEAYEYTTENLAGKTVTVELDDQAKEKDNSVLAYVWIADKLFNQTLIEQGFARVDKSTTDTKYLETFTQTQEQAKKKEIGIWSIKNYAQENGYNYPQPKKEKQQEEKTIAATPASKKETEKLAVAPKEEAKPKVQTEKKVEAEPKTAAKTTKVAEPEKTPDPPVEAAQCDIKGSQSGIYHVPGSTYYSRTKNVAQWFCSTEEAENAGYRAPKR